MQEENRHTNINKKSRKPQSIFRTVLTGLILFTMYIPLLGQAFGIKTVNYSKESLHANPSWPPSFAFFQEFDNWWKDHFPTRSYLVSANNLLLSKIFKTSGNERVVVGKEGWMFFDATVKDYLHLQTMSDEDISRALTSLRLQREYVESQGKQWAVFLIPNKNHIYPEYMPDRYKPLAQESNLSRMQAGLLDAPDLKDVLLQAKKTEKEKIYHKEDSHWTGLGSYYGYKTIMETFGLQEQILEYDSLVVKQNWEGDLTNMLYPAWVQKDEDVYFEDYEQKYIFTRPIRTREDVEITTRSDGQYSLLLFRDSFANSIMDYLSNSFAQVQYSRAIPYRYESLMKQSKADYIAVELVERNLDYLVQATPQIPLQVVENKMRAKLESAEDVEYHEDFSYTKVDSEKVDFSNFKFMNQEKAANISRVVIHAKDDFWEAFPIYTDDAIQDKKWEYGFSFYSAEITEFDGIYCEMDGQWFYVKAKS